MTHRWSVSLWMNEPPEVRRIATKIAMLAATAEV